MNDSGIGLHEDGRFDMRNPGLRLLLLLLFLLIGGQPTARAYQPDGSADEVVLTEKVFRHIGLLPERLDLLSAGRDRRLQDWR